MAEAGDGVGPPPFVEREFREFLTWGVFEAGVARVLRESFGASTWCRFPAKGAGGVHELLGAGG